MKYLARTDALAFRLALPIAAVLLAPHATARAIQAQSGGGSAQGAAPSRPDEFIDLRIDSPCLTVGDTAELEVRVWPHLQGSLHLRVTEEDDDTVVLADVTNPLTGSSHYLFQVPLPQAGMVSATARILDITGQELATDSLRLGARPILSGAPSDLCTFELVALNTGVLLEDAEQAVSTGAPFMLDLGSQVFFVLLEEITEELLAPEVLDQHQGVRLFRGELTADPETEVRLSFLGQTPAPLLMVMIDQGEGLPAVYVEPAQAFDDSHPPDLHIAYRSDHVRVPPIEDGVETTESPGGGPGPESSSPGLGTCMVLALNLYYDHDDPYKTRLGHVSNMAGSFLSQLNLRIVVTTDARIDSDGYADAESWDITNGCIDDARTTNISYDSDLGTWEGVDPHFALFLTNNWAYLDYRGTSGHAETHPSTFPGGISPRPTCWVRTDFSATSIHHIGCHEIGHLLGLAHNNAVYDTYAGFIPRFSFMVSGFDYEFMLALRWFDSEVSSMANALQNDFCPSALVFPGQGGTMTVSSQYFGTCSSNRYTLTPIPDPGWRFDGFAGNCDGQDWEVWTASATGCAGATEPIFSQLHPGNYSPACLWADEDNSSVTAPAIDWSPDSTKLVRTTGAPSNDLRVLDAGTGATITSYPAGAFGGHDSTVLAVDWSPDGSQIATASVDWRVRLFDPSDGSLDFVMSGHVDRVNCLAWAPLQTCQQFRRLASGSDDGSIRIWDADTGTLLVEITEAWLPQAAGFQPLGPVTKLDWSPDGELLLATTAGERWFFRTDGETLHELAGTLCCGASAEASALAFSPARRLLALGWANGAMELRTMPSGSTSLASYSGRVQAFAWNPDATEFFSIGPAGSQELLRRWDANTGQLIDELQACDPVDVEALAWSPNRRYLALAGVSGSTGDSTVGVLELYH